MNTNILHFYLFIYSSILLTFTIFRPKKINTHCIMSEFLEINFFDLRLSFDCDINPYILLSLSLFYDRRSFINQKYTQIHLYTYIGHTHTQSQLYTHTQITYVHKSDIHTHNHKNKHTQINPIFRLTHTITKYTHSIHL